MRNKEGSFNVNIFTLEKKKKNWVKRQSKASQVSINFITVGELL
jgi:hypothetical protein